MSRLAGAALCFIGFLLALAPLISTETVAYLVVVIGAVTYMAGTSLLIISEART